MLSFILFVASLVIFGASLYIYNMYSQKQLRKQLQPFAEVLTDISTLTAEQEKKLTTFFAQYDEFIEGYNKNNEEFAKDYNTTKERIKFITEEIKRITYIEKEKNEIEEAEEEGIDVDENFRVPIVPGLKFKFEGDDTLYKPKIVTHAKPKRKAK